MSKKNKNISKKIPNGTIVQTRDEYFKGSGDYRKPGYQERGNYRKAIVIDTNSKDELALVKVVSSGTKKVKSKNLKYKPIVETKDNNDKPIKSNSKFSIKVDKNKNVKNKISTKEANEIKRNVVKSKKYGAKNRSLLNLFKKK